MDQKPQVPEADAAKIREFVFAGRKIQAIKLLREASGLGLKEAKDVVEALEKELRETSPEKFTAKAGKGCGTTVLCCLLFVICCAWVVSVARGANQVGPYLK